MRVSSIDKLHYDNYGTHSYVYGYRDEYGFLTIIPVKYDIDVNEVITVLNPDDGSVIYCVRGWSEFGIVDDVIVDEYEMIVDEEKNRVWQDSGGKVLPKRKTNIMKINYDNTNSNYDVLPAVLKNGVVVIQDVNGEPQKIVRQWHSLEKR